LCRKSAGAKITRAVRGDRTPEVELIAQSVSSTEPDGARIDLVRALLNGPVDSAGPGLNDSPDRALVGPSGEPHPLYPLGRDGPVVVSASGCQRFFLTADAFAFFVGDATFAAGTITLCIGITIGCPGSIPSC
jgi:hypothetical protein